MAVLPGVLKFVLLFLLTVFVVRLLVVGLIGNVCYITIYRKLLGEEFDSQRQTVFTQLYGLPVSAILVSLGSITAMAFLRFGRTAILIFFVLLILFAIRDYADDAISNVTRSFVGFLVEMLVYGVFLVKVATG